MSAYLLTLAVLSATPEPVEAPVPAADLTFALSTGFDVLQQYSSKQPGDVSSIAMANEMSMALRWSMIEVGALARYDLVLSGGDGWHFGGFLGYVNRSPSGARFELAASAGLHRVTKLGSSSSGSLTVADFLGPSSSTQGFDTELPFVGVRLGVSKTIAPDQSSHAVIGVVLYADVDTTNAQGTTSTSSTCGLFAPQSSSCSGDSTNRVDATIGTIGLMFYVGWTRDLGR